MSAPTNRSQSPMFSCHKCQIQVKIALSQTGDCHMAAAADLKIPHNWPLKVPFFQILEKKGSFQRHSLDVKLLSENECHLFFPLQPCEEYLVATALEFYTFPPLTPMNEKFNIDPIVIGEIGLQWCRFPKEFMDVCQRAGKAFNMQMKNKSVSMVMRSTRLDFPTAPNILWFECDRSYNQELIDRQITDVRETAKAWHRLGVD